MEEQKLSKNQLKKIKKQEQWLQKKQQKKTDKKAKKGKKKPKPNILFRSNRAEWDSRRSEGQKIIIDCEFDSLLTDKEKGSLKQQIMYCHALNKRSEHPINFIATGVSAWLTEELSKVSWGNWPLELLPESYLDKYPKEKLVYLTADSENELDSFDKDMVYIIGGMVDHNRLKMITFNKATEQGISTARLPLNKYVKLERSAVLTVNHVAGLILKFLETNDWGVSIQESIPARKYAKLSEE